MTPAAATPPSPRALRVIPTLRANLGSLYLLSPHEDAPAFSVSVQGGALVGWPRKNVLERGVRAALWLLPELGYDHRRFDPAPGQPPPTGPFNHREAHMMSMGMGVGYGSLMYILGTYSVRLVAGTIEGNTAVGFRHGVSAHILGTLISINIEHQVVQYGDGVHQDLMCGAGLNVLAPFFMKYL